MNIDIESASGYFDFFDTRPVRPSTEALILDNAHDGVRPVEVYSPQAVAIDVPTAEDLFRKLSFIGRLCWDKDWNRDPERFVRHIISMGHESVIEHTMFTFLILCDRATSHELVRHRIANFTQMSQRYISYADVTKPAPIVLPEIISSEDGLRPLTDEEEFFFVDGAIMSLTHYRIGVNHGGLKPEQARLVLPNECATMVAVTFNARSLRNFLKLRMAGSAYPQIRAVANDIYDIVVEAGLGVLVEEFVDNRGRMMRYDELQMAFDTRGIVRNRSEVKGE